MARRKPKTAKPVAAPMVRAKFDLAQTTNDNKRHWANTDGLSARAATNHAVRRVVRLRSRYEAENNSWYSGIIRTAANHIIGRGPRLQLLTGNPEANARVEMAWRDWASKSNLSDMLRVLFEAYWRDGEVFLMRASRPRWYPLDLDIRTFEADQVSSPWDATAYNDPFVDDGIRFDRQTNELEYYVYDQHPGSNVPTSTLNGRWYNASEVLHLYRVERPGQIRGIPRATPALQTLPIMRRQELATLFSAETAANFAMYLKTNGAVTPANYEGPDFAEIELTRNMLTTLPEGWDIGQVEPKQPGPLYEMFQRQALMSFCRCTNMPYTLAAGTGKDANFSSFKGDMTNVWQPEVIVEQSRFESLVIEPIFRWFLDRAALVVGLLDGLPPIDQIAHQWHWPPLPELDAVEAATAAEIRIASGQSTLTAEHARRGQDWNVESQRAADDFGVDVATYRAAVFAKTFGLVGQTLPATATAQPAQVGPSGEYTQLGQRAFNNNAKRIEQTLQRLAVGEISEGLARTTLTTIGLSPANVQALIDDARDGAIDSQIPEVAT